MIDGEQTLTHGAAVDSIKEMIGRRLQALRGPRTLEAQAEKMGITKQRLAQMEAGDIPNAFLYLVRLAEADGVSLEYLLLGRGAV